MGGPNKYGSEDIQNELRTKLESLFSRENLEKDVYFIARMKDSLEIPMQVVYQQRDIYKICPNGRYVLQAILNCKNLSVSADKLFVVPQILPKKICVFLKVSDNGLIEQLLQSIQQNYKQAIAHIQQVSATSAILTTSTEEEAQALNNWIKENGMNVESEIILENLLAGFKENVKEELKKYYEKLNEDKKSTEMFENLEFFSHQSQFPVEDKSKIGENVFSNPYNYFFYSQPQQEVNQLQPYLAYIMMQQQAMMMGQQGQVPTQDNRNNLRRNKHGDHPQQLDQQQSGQHNNKRYKSKGKQGEARNGSNKDGKQKYTFVAKTATQTKKGSKKSKPFQPNEDQFPSLNAENANTVSLNATPAQEQNKSQTKDTTPAAPVNRTSRKENAEKSKVSKEGNGQKEHASERQVSESKERQSSRNHQKSVNHKNEETNEKKKTEEVVFFRKGKDIKIAYEKDALLNIFLGIKDRITPPASIVESSKDEFIPVININAPRDIEHTHPTEVDLNSLSNPGTPYLQTASVPLRKHSISRSNIGRKESEKILEVDEKKKL